MKMILNFDEALSLIKTLEMEKEELSKKLIHVENELKTSKLRYQKAMEDLDTQLMYTKIILKDSPVSVLFFDADKRLIFASNKVMDDLMISHMDNLDASCIDLSKEMDGESYQLLSSTLEKSLRQNETIKIDILLQRKNGEKINFKTNIIPIHEESNGQIIGVSVVGHDVTEITKLKEKAEEQVTIVQREKQRAEAQKEHAEAAMRHAEKERAHAQMAMSLAERAKQIAEVSKQKADEANKAKSKFLANMSHEIRTPMNTIVGISEIIKAETKEKTTLAHVEDIIESSRWLQQMINDILDFSKIEANQFSIVPTNFNLYTLLQSMNTTMEILAKEKGLHYESVVHAGVPEAVFADEIRIRQVLLNILNNAVKYTSKGRVDFEVRANENMLIFEINDSGIGIREKDIPFLFDAFKQFDKEKNRGIIGTGLGLSIAKRLCELMKGDVYVTSTYGMGSTFRVILPFIAGNPDLIGEADNTGQVSAPKAKVLVVDDIYMNLKVAKGLFRLFDIQIDTAESGQDAVRMVGQKDYDLVFMDHMMPGMNGIEATAAIRGLDEKYKKLKIVALTAYAIAGAKEMFLENQFDDYLPKPIEKLQLNAMLAKLLPSDLVRYMEENEEKTCEDVQRSDRENVILECLSTVNGLDLEKGLEYNACQVEDYIKSIELLLRLVDEKTESLINLLEEGQTDLLAKEVHSLKGGLLIIGESRLSRMAALLEEEARSGNLSYCELNTKAFCDALKIFAGITGSIITTGADRQTERTKGNDTLLKQYLVEVKKDLERFDADQALQTLKEAEQYTFGEQADENIRAIRFATDGFDYNKAKNICKTLMETIE